MKSFLLFSLFLALVYGEIEDTLLKFSKQKTQDAVNLIKNKCDKNGGNGTFEKYLEKVTEAQPCVQNLFNITKFQQEIEDAKPTGSMDEVFDKYCQKKDDIFKCMVGAQEALKKCLNEEEENLLDLANNITNRMLLFACDKKGDRLAMFVAEDGPECIKSEKDEIGKCLKESFGSKFNLNGFMSFFDPNFKPFTFGTEECNDYKKLRKCVVEKLENCKNKTPANMIDAVFKFVKTSLPC